MGCSMVSRNDDGEFRRGTAQRQKNFFADSIAFFAPTPDLIMRPPSGGIRSTLRKSRGWGRHTRASPPV